MYRHLPYKSGKKISISSYTAPAYGFHIKEPGGPLIDDTHFDKHFVGYSEDKMLIMKLHGSEKNIPIWEWVPIPLEKIKEPNSQDAMLARQKAKREGYVGDDDWIMDRAIEYMKKRLAGEASRKKGSKKKRKPKNTIPTEQIWPGDMKIIGDDFDKRGNARLIRAYQLESRKRLKLR